LLCDGPDGKQDGQKATFPKSDQAGARTARDGPVAQMLMLRYLLLQSELTSLQEILSDLKYEPCSNIR